VDTTLSQDRARGELNHLGRGRRRPGFMYFIRWEKIWTGKMGL